MSKARYSLERQDNDYNFFSQRIMDKVEAWCIRHATFLFIIILGVFMALFIALIFALVGVSATESGTVYNQFQNII